MTPRASKRTSGITTETESIQAYHLFIFQQNFDALGDVFHGPPQNVKLGSGV